jgi:hypothetical protein
MRLIFESTKVLLEYFFAKRMDGLKIIGVNKDLIKAVAILF